MEFFANPKTLQSVFMVPSEVVDNNLKLASAAQLKTLLFLMRHMSDKIETEDIAKALNLPTSEISDALNFWVSSGVLLKSGNAHSTLPAENKPEEKKSIVRPQTIKPTREEIAIRGSENEQIMLLLREAQNKFGRTLKINEASTIVWLFDDEGMDISLILMLIEYAKSENRCNISFIEKTAVEWLKNNITTIAQADKYISEMYLKKTAWKIVEKKFGIEDRLASSKELYYSNLWLNEWKMDESLLSAAYEKCVDTKSKFIMSYTAKILEGWHEKGYKKATDIKSDQKPQKKSSMSTSDIGLLEEMLNNSYKED